MLSLVSAEPRKADFVNGLIYVASNFPGIVTRRPLTHLFDQKAEFDFRSHNSSEESVTILRLEGFDLFDQLLNSWILGHQ